MTNTVDIEPLPQIDSVSSEVKQDSHSQLEDLQVVADSESVDIGDELGEVDEQFDFGTFKGSVDTPFTITSFEDLEALVCGEKPVAKGRYVFKAKDVGSDFMVGAKSPRIPLDYLPVYIGNNSVELVYWPDSIKAFKYAAPLIGIHRERLTSALDCFGTVDILNSSTLISVNGYKLKLPYGEFDLADYHGSQLFNPLVINRIVDIYCSRTVFDRAEIIRVIESNLYEKIYSGNSETSYLFSNLEAYKTNASVSFPDLRSKEYSSLSKNASRLWEFIDDFFFRTILPLAFMNDDFKSYVGCSLLSHDNFNERHYEKIGAAYAYYLCGIENVARLFNTKSIDIASFDSKAIFGGKYSSFKKFELHAEQQANAVKTKSVKEVFAIDGEKRQTVDLTGHSVSSEALTAFTAMGKKHPHFSKVFDYLLPFVESSFFNGTPLVIPPMLIAGPPGIGKTKYISELFEVFGYPISHCHSSQFTCGSGLVGLQSTWSNTQPGYVAEALRRTKFFNPLIAFDELERVRMAHQGGNGVSVEAAFMRLLEPLEAKSFVDACGQMPHDVSKVNWIFTCNEPSLIPPALLSRLNKVCVYPPTEESVIDNIHRDIWLDLVNQYASGGQIKPWISADALENLREVYYGDLNFRSGIKVMKQGLNKLMSGVQDSNYLTLDVISSKPLKRATYN